MKKEKQLTIILCFLVTGCFKPDRKLMIGIKEGNKLYYQGNYISANRKLSAIISSYPNSPATAEAYYIRGLIRVKENNLILAEQDFKQAIKLAHRDDLKRDANICLGSIYFKRKLWDKAYHCYKKASKHLAEVSPNEWVLYRLGLVAQRTGRWREAKKYFARVIREFPKTRASYLARKKINYEYFSIQAGAFVKHSGADKRYNSLKIKKFPAVRIENRQFNGKQIYVVLVGKYEDMYQATSALKRVKSVVPDARIVP